jgi:3,5-epimerase/4-reductase
MFILYGGNGWIGQKVVNILKDMHIELHVSLTRVDDVAAIEKEIREIQPTHILCLLGRTHGTFEGEYVQTIDYLEKKGKIKENVRDNLFCPLALAILCQKFQIHLTYLGTGCIFTYKDDKKVFSEEDKPNFFGSSYSVVKGYTDQLMQFFDNVLNVRIRMPISSDTSPRNFLMKMLKYDKICSVQNSMTVLDELLPIMCQMSINKETGTINLTNPGTIEHFEILDMMKEIIDPNISYQLFSYEEQMKVISSERSNNELDATKLLLKYNVKNIKESVRETIHQFSKNLKKKD